MDRLDNLISLENREKLNKLLRKQEKKANVM